MRMLTLQKTGDGEKQLSSRSGLQIKSRTPADLGYLLTAVKARPPFTYQKQNNHNLQSANNIQKDGPS